MARDGSHAQRQPPNGEWTMKPTATDKPKTSSSSSPANAPGSSTSYDPPMVRRELKKKGGVTCECGCNGEAGGGGGHG